MNIDPSQFRNQDIPHLLNSAAGFASQLGLARLELPVFFIALQQANPQETQAFLQAAGANPEQLYQNVSGLINDMPRGGTGALPMSDELSDALQLTLKIEQMIPQGPFPHGALLTALFTVQSPLRLIGQAMGLTSSSMQALLDPPPAPEAAVPNRQQPSRATVTQQPSASQRTSQSTEANDAPTVAQFCTNWLERARRGEIEPAIGRDEEIKRVLQILSRRTKNNPVLVGEPGTGKTAIVEGLAHRLLSGDVPEELAGLKLYQLDLGVITSIGNAEEIMRTMVEELKRDPMIVLFIDEIHTLVGAHSEADNAIANLLKPEMARGTIKLLGATTLDEYTKHIEKDKAFERRFQKVMVDEPDPDTAIIIIKGIKSRFEAHHHVAIPDSIVESAVRLSHRYITDRRLPDKAIDLIDEAASCLRMEHGERNTLQESDVMDVVTRWTGIPMQNLSEDDTERLQHIEEHLHKSVIGQDKAITAVANAIRRSRMGLNDAARPIGSFLFLGTTGTGKTELCKALADFLFHSRDMIVRIDMSEYQQEHSVARLFGAPPGYVGYEQGGQLTEAVRRKPYSLVLFDEIEKAHPKIFETLLQVLDDGRMTDGQGRLVDFKNTLIVMTSNMGQDVIMRNLTGHEPTNQLIEHTTEGVIGQLRMRVAPEFLNRIDNIVMFLPLTRSDIRQIAELQMKSTVTQLAANNIRLSYTPAVLDFIAEKGYQPEYGGRPVKRAINTYVKDAITNAIVGGMVRRDLPILADVANGSIVFSNGTYEHAGSPLTPNAGGPQTPNPPGSPDSPKSPKPFDKDKSPNSSKFSNKTL